MRVFLCGAQGTGKSTLVNLLPIKILGLEKKDSFSRPFLAKNPDVQLAGKSGHDEFQDKILLHCLTQYVNDKDFISSRSIIDSYAYINTNDCKHKVMLLNILSHYRDYLLTKDDIYIYLPIEFEITDGNNSTRNLDKLYQAGVDKKMKEYFERLKGLGSGSQFYTLTGTIESRLEELTNIIRDKIECSI